MSTVDELAPFYDIIAARGSVRQVVAQFLAADKHTIHELTARDQTAIIEILVDRRARPPFALTTLLDKVYDGVPMRPVAMCLNYAPTIQQTSRGNFPGPYAGSIFLVSEPHDETKRRKPGCVFPAVYAPRYRTMVGTELAFYPDEFPMRMRMCSQSLDAWTKRSRYVAAADISMRAPVISSLCQFASALPYDPNRCTITVI